MECFYRILTKKLENTAKTFAVTYLSEARQFGSLLNNESIMSETGLNQITYEKYKSFCNAASLTFEVQPWAKPNKVNKRFVKSKKMYFTDTNFLCFMIGNKFKKGVVLYTGEDLVPYGDKLWAVPVNYLWE